VYGVLATRARRRVTRTMCENCSTSSPRCRSNDAALEFRTVIAAAYPDHEDLVVVGTLKGSITLVARGARGFGYDPVFAPEGGGGRTLAEMVTRGEECHLAPG